MIGIAFDMIGRLAGGLVSMIGCLFLLLGTTKG